MECIQTARVTAREVKESKMGTEMMWGIGFLVVMGAFIWWRTKNKRGDVKGTWDKRPGGGIDERRR